MSLTTMIHDLTEHLKVYLLAGTLVAVGVDVAGNVAGSRTMAGVMGAMATGPDPVIWVIHGIGWLIVAVGGALYLGNMWCGFVALRAWRFRFAERGLLLKAGGWSLAFVYVVSSAVIGLAVNAVYLALVT